MLLHWSPRSPFVRKVMMVAHERGLADRLECVRTVVAFGRPHDGLMRQNPQSRLPTPVLDDGTVLYDSRVICEPLDTLHDGPRLFPASRPARMTALRRQAPGDGMLDTGLGCAVARCSAIRRPPAAVLDAFASRLLGSPAQQKRAAKVRRMAGAAGG